MMHSMGFDHTNDALPGSPDDPAATGESASFFLDNNIEILYVPGNPDYWEAIERPSATPSSGQEPISRPK